MGLFWRVLLLLWAAFEMHMRLSPLVAMVRTQAWPPVMGPGRIFSRGFKGLHCRCAEYTLVEQVEARSWVQWSGGSTRVAVPWWWSQGGSPMVVILYGGTMVAVPWWFHGDGPMVAGLWWWSRGSPMVAVLWWWSHVAWAWVGIAKEEKVRF